MAFALRKFHGVCVRWWPEKAYGFVRIDGGREAHVHLGDFENRTGADEVTKGTRLTFYLSDDPKGLSAIRVEKETINVT